MKLLKKAVKGLASLLTRPFRALEQTKGWRRWVLLLAYSMIGLSLWLGWVWSTALWGLPDIGVTFVQPVKERKPSGSPLDSLGISMDTIEEIKYLDDAKALELEDNASALKSLYEQRTPLKDNDLMTISNLGSWSKSSKSAQSWVLSNEGAIDQWREFVRTSPYMVWPFLHKQGSGYDARFETFAPRSSEFRQLSWAMLLMASKAEEANQLAEAWHWRSAYSRATQYEISWSREMFLISKGWAPLELEGVRQWAKHPKNTVPMLQTALTELVEMKQAKLDPLSWVHESLLATKNRLEDEGIHHMAKKILALDHPSSYYTSDPRWQKIKLLLLREPERAQRIIRLVHANWLTGLRNASFQVTTDAFQGAESDDLYLVWPAGQPEDAMRFMGLTKKDILKWNYTSPYSRSVLFANHLPENWTNMLDDRNERIAKMSIVIAQEIFFKEKGRKPADVDELLKSDLKLEQLLKATDQQIIPVTIDP